MQKIAHFFLVKMIAGIALVVGLIVLVEWLRSVFPASTNLPTDAKNLIVALVESALATAAYIFLFTRYEKRQIDELSWTGFKKYAYPGFITGVLLQTLFIVVILITQTFFIVEVNPLSTLISALAFALMAGFVAEIILIGIVFRLLEEKAGTAMALAFFIVAFALLHVNVKGANIVSVSATAMQAGFLLPAAFVYSRSLWLPVFIHFGWDFTEPGIFGAINPSTSLNHGLFTSKIAGNPLFTGGQTGPQDSLSSLVLCALLGIIFLMWAKRKNLLVKMSWSTSSDR